MKLSYHLRVILKSFYLISSTRRTKGWKRSWKKMMAQTLKEMLKRYGFNVVSEKELVISNYEAYFAILSSSSVVFLQNGDEYFLSLFPCDIRDGKSLRIKVHKFLEEIIEKIGEPKIFAEIPFTIGEVKYNHHLLGDGNKIVGYAGIISNSKIYYKAINMKTESEILKSKNYQPFLKSLEKVTEFDGYLYKGFGYDEGYSIIMYNIKKVMIVTIHTWPESGNAHLEIISKEGIDMNIEEKIYRNYKVISEYEVTF